MLADQAAEVARLVYAGQTETPARPLANSIATMALIDEAAARSGRSGTRSASRSSARRRVA